MSQQYDDLVTLFKSVFFEILESQRPYRRMILGNGQGGVSVPGREDYVYARDTLDDPRIQEVFNKRVEGADGTPIIVGELYWQPGLDQVIAIDWDAYAGSVWGGGFSGVPAHGQAHQYPSEADPGGDPVLVFQPALQPLKLTGNGADMTVTVQSLAYDHNGTYKRFAGGTADLTAYVPATASTVVSILVCLDTESNGLVTVSGGEVADTVAIVPKPSIPADHIAAGYVQISTGQTSVSTEDDITDGRAFLMAPPNDLAKDGTFGAYVPITDNAGWVVDEKTGVLIMDEI